MHRREDVRAIYSISFHRSSVRIVETIFLIRNTHLNLQKKNLVILLSECENWTLLLEKEHRQFFGIGCEGGGTYLKVKSIGRENNLYKERFRDLQSSCNIIWAVKSKQDRWKDHVAAVR
jgi:hypothetical protein